MVRTGMIREADSMYNLSVRYRGSRTTRRRPRTHIDIVAETLEREHGRLAADITEGDVGLDAQDPL
jgi:hypothetical protein